MPNWCGGFDIIAKIDIINFMKITIKQTNLENTPALIGYINKKLGSLSKFLKEAGGKTEPFLYLEIARNTKHHHSGNVFTTEAKLVLPRQTLFAKHSDIDIRAAIDILKNKLSQEIKKYKERALEKRHAL